MVTCLLTVRLRRVRLGLLLEKDIVICVGWIVFFKTDVKVVSGCEIFFGQMSSFYMISLLYSFNPAEMLHTETPHTGIYVVVLNFSSRFEKTREYPTNPP